MTGLGQNFGRERQKLNIWYMRGWVCVEPCHYEKKIERKERLRHEAFQPCREALGRPTGVLAPSMGLKKKVATECEPTRCHRCMLPILGRTVTHAFWQLVYV